MNHKHKHRGYHRAAAFTQSLGKGLAESLNKAIAEQLCRQYQQADNQIMQGLKQGLSHFLVPFSDNAWIVVSTKDRHPFTLEPLDTE